MKMEQKTRGSYIGTSPSTVLQKDSSLLTYMDMSHVASVNVEDARSPYFGPFYIRRSERSFLNILRS